MQIAVVSCGPSGANWDGKGYSIGVNDCEKFGKPVNRLIVVNDNFEPSREVFIRKSRAPDGFFSQLDYWKDHPNYKDIGVMKHFNNRIDPGVLYHATTSPFIAMSMAFNIGAKEIVLWGVDFIAHPIKYGDSLEREVDTYMRFIEALRNRNCSVSLGTDYGAFKGKILVKK